MKKIALTALLLACASPLALALDTVAARQDIDRFLDGKYPGLDRLYKDLHQHPELGFQEYRTAKVLADAMRKLGFTVTEKVGKTGIVAIYRNGAGPTVMVRSELDALPMQEKTGLPYASTQKTKDQDGRETFVAHSCGHDLHMASWVGTAATLVSLKDKWKGTLMFVAQPAEEELSGARSMVDDALFSKFGKPDYAFALHTAPMEYGYLTYKAGPQTSNGDSFALVFKGKGGHGSMPERTIDPIVIGARFVTDVQSLVSREVPPNRFGVVSVGAFNAGTVGNIIPDEAVLLGTVRTYDPGVRTQLLNGIRRIALASAQAANAPAPDISIGTSQADAVLNDAALTDRTAKVFKSAFGDKAIQAQEPSPASEDFSVFVEHGIPSLYFMIGVFSSTQLKDWAARGQPVPGNHSPFFAPVPEPSIRTGVTAMSLAVMNVMQP